LDTDGPTRVGTRATEIRKTPGGTQTITYEITAHEAPRLASFRGLNGPIRPVGSVTVEPAAGGSRVAVELDFEGHGIGKLLPRLVSPHAYAPGQSSAHQTNSAPTVSGRGTHGAATSEPSPTGPGWMWSPSSGARRKPQTKQCGKSESTSGRCASTASSQLGGGGGS